MQENRWAHWSNLTTSSIIANEVKGGMAKWLCHLWDNLVFESPLNVLRAGQVREASSGSSRCVELRIPCVYAWGVSIQIQTIPGKVGLSSHRGRSQSHQHVLATSRESGHAPL